MIPSETFSVNWAAFFVVIPGCLTFGLIYNIAVNWITTKGYHDGLVWLEVVFGVAATLLFAVPIIGVANVIALFCLFAATGLFMVLGDIWRFIQRAHNFSATIGKHRHDPSETPAKTGRTSSTRN